MLLKSWLQNLRSSLAPGRGQRHHRRRCSLRSATHRPNLEVLDDRALPSFLGPVTYAVGADPQAIVSADFNGGGPDIAVANYSSNTVSVLLGDGLGGFGAKSDFATGANPRSLAVGDVSGDGKLDLITANAQHVGILRGDGAGNFALPDIIGLPGQFPSGYVGTDPLYQSPQSVATGDFNGDGLLDLAVTGVTSFVQKSYWGYYGPYYTQVDNAYVNVLISNGSGGFNPTVTTPLNSLYSYSIAVGRFDADAKDDLAYSQYSVAAGDVNGDLKTDLVTANRYGNDVSVILGDGLGGFGGPQNFAVGSEPTSVVLGDFNNDTKVDIATANFSSNDVSILRGDGNGIFSTVENFAAGMGAYAVAASDFNGDGWLDVATANVSGNSSVLINDQSWPFIPPTVSVSDVSVTEGNTGTVNATFTVSLLYASTVDVTVHYDTTAGTATAGSDYTTASGDVTIPAGQTSRTFTVAVIGDRLAEPTETFAVALSAPITATIGDGQGIGIILDDEPLISINDVTVTEGNTGSVNATFTVTLSAVSDVDVTVHYATANGSATASDYTAASGDVIIAAGQTTKTFTVAVIGDRSAESTENFVVNLSAPVNAGIGVGQGVGTIFDNEPRISISDVTKAEGRKNKTTLFTFTITLSAAYDQAVTMSYRTVDGTAKTSDRDYVAQTGTLIFAPGQTTKTITILVTGDSKREANETFFLDLFGNSINSLFTKNRGIGTILNDD